MSALTRLDRFEAPGEIRIDVCENDTGYEVRVEVPGAKKQASRRTLAIQ
jgi:HSP20 family molecular chaperone IbpA